jgi:hypothetical protein
MDLLYILYLPTVIAVIAPEPKVPPNGLVRASVPSEFSSAIGRFSALGTKKGPILGFSATSRVNGAYFASQLHLHLHLLGHSPQSLLLMSYRHSFPSSSRHAEITHFFVSQLRPSCHSLNIQRLSLLR